MQNRRKILYGASLAAAAVLTGAGMLYCLAPAGPGQAKGLAGRYYNWAYARTSCSAAPEKYEDENISFSNFSYKDAPDMERRSTSGFGAEKKPLAAAILNYEQQASYPAGNTYINIYKPAGKRAASADALTLFTRKYAEENAGPEPRIAYGTVPGAPFSAWFGSGAREGVCFTDNGGALYCFTDQNMAMQNGGVPLLPVLLHSAGIGSYSLNDYAVLGLKDWLARPAREKVSECNFMEIKRTLKVKEKR